MAEPSTKGGGASFAVKNHYFNKAGVLVCQEIATYQLSTNQDGYLITFTMDLPNDRSECWILAAAQPEDEPIARISLPGRQP